MPPAWCGRSTWAASTSIRTRCAPTTSPTPTNCASTSTRCRACDWRQIVDVALVAREVLEDHGLTAWPKTSGSRGFHIYARIQRRWPFKFVRLAAQTVAREVERRAPELATGTVVEGGARRRVRRLQPERLRPHRRVGVLGAGHPGRPGVDAAALGRGRRLPARGLHDRDRARAVRGARRSVGGHGRRTRARWTRCSTSPTGSARPRRRRRVRGEGGTGNAACPRCR